MSDTSLQILLVEDNPGDALLVQEMLSDLDPGTFAVRRAGSLLEALDALARESSDVVLLDLNLPDSFGLETFTSLRTHVPDVPVVLLTGNDDDAMAMRAVEKGAQDYLVKDRLDSETLIRALRYAVVRQQRDGNGGGTRPAARGGQIIGLLGAKGGVGATTVACHLASALKALSNSSVLLADADLDGGTAGFMMQAKTPYTLLDAVENVYRLDEGFWHSMVHTSRSGVDVITSPALLGKVDVPEMGRLRHVLRYARASYKWVVIDLGRLDAVARSMLTDLDRLLLVTNSDLMSVHDAGRVAESLTEMGIPDDRVALVHNHSSRQSAGLDVLKSVVPLAVHADLPAADKELAAACTRGELVAADCAFGGEIRRLAQTVSGLECGKKEGAGFSLKKLPLFGGREASATN
jgi:Flp pilus assembly CpaE family ATPase